MINIERSMPAPEILEVEKEKVNGNYLQHEVIERLKDDFHNKCYICENGDSTTLNVEHRIPHKNDANLKFAWANLYWACGHCNNIKGPRFQPMLDCTSEEDLILDHIEFDFRPFPKERPDFKNLSGSAAASNTVDLLNAVFNGTTLLKKIEANSLRSLLLTEIRKFQDLLFRYYDESDSIGEQEKGFIRDRIQNHLNAASPFAAFKRCIVKNNPEIHAEFTHPES